MKKAVYLPTNSNTIVTEEIDENFVEILIDNEYKIVPRDEVRIELVKTFQNSFDYFNQCMMASLIKNPSSDLLYSHNDRLTPEAHQYKPLIKFLNSQNNRLLIADEVGLGKTIEAGMIFKEVDKRDDLSISLVVVPSSLTLKWRNELLLRFDEEFEILNINSFKGFLEEFEIYSNSKAYRKRFIISYNTLRDEKVVELLKDSSIKIDFLIMDEAHTFRNSTTSTYEAAFAITNLSDYVLFLTATPVQNNYQDLFTILSLLDEDTFLDFDYFIDLIRPNQLIHKTVAMLKNGEQLNEIQTFISNQDFDFMQLTWPQKDIFENFMRLSDVSREERVNYISQFTESDNLSYIINRTKKKDAGKFIPREAHSSSIEISFNENLYYKAVVEFVIFLFSHKNPKIPSGFITVMPERMVSSCMLASLESFKEMRKSKKFMVNTIDDIDSEEEDFSLDDEILDRLDSLIDAGDLIQDVDSKFEKFISILNGLKKQKITKVIVFSFFKKTLSYLERKLLEQNFSILKIDGDLSPDERYEKIRQFKDEPFEILLSSEVGSEGLDMQFCNVVINYDLPWNPMRVEQRIGRIDRIGQKAEKLLIFNLLVTGTIEDRIYSRLYNRLGIFESSIGELEPILGDIQKDFKIEDIIQMSQEDLDKKLELEQQSLIRKAKEIKENIHELDSMMNDEYFKENNFDTNAKKAFIANNCQNLFLNFLEKHNISFKQNNDIYTLGKDQTKQLHELLSLLTVNQTHHVLQHKKMLRKLAQLDKFHFSFNVQAVDRKDIELINIANPMMKAAAEDFECEFDMFTSVSSAIEGSFAVVYKTEFNSSKKLTNHKVLIVDDEFNKLKQMDYYEFYERSQRTINPRISVSKMQHLRDSSQRVISEDFSNALEHEKMTANEMLSKKKNALIQHFAKKRKIIASAKDKVTQTDIIRMRQAQLDSIEDIEKVRLMQLEEKMKVNGSFQILSVIEMIQ